MHILLKGDGICRLVPAKDRTEGRQEQVAVGHAAYHVSKELLVLILLSNLSYQHDEK